MTAPNADPIREALTKAADAGYRICAESRHITLGDKVRTELLALAHRLSAPADQTTNEPVEGKAPWEILRDIVTPAPFPHNEQAWSIMLRLIREKCFPPTNGPAADQVNLSLSPEAIAEIEAIERAPQADMRSFRVGAADQVEAVEDAFLAGYEAHAVKSSYYPARDKAVAEIVAALSPSPAPVEVVAWMYEKNGGRVLHLTRTPEFVTKMGHIETPLYRHPPTPTVAADQVEAVSRDIRIAIWNAGMNGGMGQDLTQAFIRRAMDEPTMQQAIAAIGQSPEVEEREIVAWLLSDGARLDYEKQPETDREHPFWWAADAISRGEHKEGK